MTDRELFFAVPMREFRTLSLDERINRRAELIQRQVFFKSQVDQMDPRSYARWLRHMLA